MQAKDIKLLKGSVLHDGILVAPLVIEKSGKAGKVIKPKGYDDKDEYGTVMLVGGGKMLENGTRLPMSVKPGDFILFQKYSASKIRHEGTDYLLIRDEDIYWKQ